MADYEQDWGKSPTRLDSGAGGHAPGTSGTDMKQMSEEMKRSASDMAERAKKQGRSMLEQQKEGAAKQADSVGHAFRTAAQQLEQEGQAQAGHYVAMLANQIETLGRQLRDKDLNTLVRQAQDLGRRAPATFFAGSLVAGFLLTRFLKSSAKRQHGMADMSDQQNYSDYWREDSGANAMDEVYGSPASEGLSASPFSDDLASPLTGKEFSSGGTTDSSDMRSAGGSAAPMTASSAPAAGSSTGSSADAGTSSSSLSNGSSPGGNTYGNR